MARELIEAWNRRDIDALLAAAAPDVEWTPAGPAAVERLDDTRVLVLMHFSAHGKKSGLAMGQVRTDGATLFHVSGGKVTRYVFYWQRNRALADVGLKE